MTRIWDCFSRIEKAVVLLCFAAAMYLAGGVFEMRKSAAALPPVFEDAPKAKAIAYSPNASSVISVHVAGEVNKPGVLRVPENARIGDVLKLAGGATKNADLNSVNLAQKLKDGEQVLVREIGASVSPSTPPGVLTAVAKRSTSSAKLSSRAVNVNTASSSELETLPGIGPKTAAQIMANRAKKPFRSLDDLDEVKGLGPKKLEKLGPFVVF